MLVKVETPFHPINLDGIQGEITGSQALNKPGHELIELDFVKFASVASQTYSHSKLIPLRWTDAMKVQSSHALICQAVRKSKRYNSKLKFVGKCFHRK